MSYGSFDYASYHGYSCLCACAGAIKIQERVWNGLPLEAQVSLLSGIKSGKDTHDLVAKVYLNGDPKKPSVFHGRTQQHAADAAKITLLTSNLESGSPLQKHLAVTALAKMSLRENLRKKIAGAIPLLMALVHSTACVEPALAVLANLAQTKKLKRRILAAGALPVLAGMLCSQGGDTKQSAEASKVLFVLVTSMEARLQLVQTPATAKLFNEFIALSLGMAASSAAKPKKAAAKDASAKSPSSESSIVAPAQRASDVQESVVALEETALKLAGKMQAMQNELDDLKAGRVAAPVAESVAELKEGSGLASVESLAQPFLTTASVHFDVVTTPSDAVESDAMREWQVLDAEQGDSSASSDTELVASGL